MSSLATLPRNHGRMLPAWLSTRDPEAVRGTAHVRAVDANLIVGLDTRRHVYQVWGPSLDAGGWVPLCDCQDDAGRPFRGAVPWALIVASLVQARGGELSSDVAARHNEQLARAKDAALDREVEEGCKYYARGVAGSLEGWGRWDHREVEDGLRMAREGGSKATPRGRVYSVGAQGA